MGINIVKSNEPIDVSIIKVMLYGQPGVGKTSTAFTASNVLMLDCDNGAYRSAFRKDIVDVTCWEDIANISEDDLKGYDTVVIDTVGRLLDFLAASLISGNPKLGYQGALSLQGYGQLKSQFAQWAKRLTTMGKDIVMIAHDKEDKRGDETVVRPDIQGGSYGEVFKIADAVGYMYRGVDGNVLDFNPSTKWEGKNVAGIDAITLPNFTTNGDFFAEVIENIKSEINRMGKEGKIIADTVSAFQGKVKKIKDAEGANKAMDEVSAGVPIAQQQMKAVLWRHVKTLDGVDYSEDTLTFIDKDKQEAKPEEAADDKA